MEQIHTSFLAKPIQQQSHYSIFKRIANLILATAGVIICIKLWLISSEHSVNWHTKQSNQLGVSLSALSGNMLASSLLTKNSDEISEKLAHIAADPHVAGVSLFDNKGRLLAGNNSTYSVIAAYKLNKISPLVFVQKISHQQQTIGYLNVILKEQTVMEFHSEYQKQLNQQVQMLMLLAAIVGILITRAFYKVRYRQLLKSDKTPN